jgi:hypothetical protein
LSKLTIVYRGLQFAAGRWFFAVFNSPPAAGFLRFSIRRRPLVFHGFQFAAGCWFFAVFNSPPAAGLSNGFLQ